MIVRKQYIPKRYRNKKLVNTSASGGFIAGSSNSTFIPEHKELRGIVTITDILNEGATDIHLTKTVAESLLTTITNFNNWFEWDGTGTAIKAKHALYSVGSVSAYGIGSAGGGSGTGSTVVWGTESAGAVPLTVEGVTKTLSLALHTHSGYITEETDPTVPDHVKAITQTQVTNWDSYGTSAHSHLNKSLLDTYTQTESDLADAVAKKHTHSNKTVLDATTASFTTADESKLDGLINYTHPTNHDPSIITQDPYNRFFTDIERTKLSGIEAGADVNVQSDWNATSGDALILNKPTVFTPDIHDHYVADILNFPTSMPASDVSGWAKASVKPTYNASEIGGLGASYRWLTDAYITTWNSKANGTHTHLKSDITNFAHTHNLSEIGITGLTANYLTKFNGSTLVNSRIFDNGTNVGIGTAYPEVLLDVAGSMYIRGNQTFAGAGTHYIGGASEGINLSWTWWNGASDQQWMYLKDGGNVGIATNDPTATLDVNGIGKFKDDILMPFNTWSNATDKNSLNKFLKLFDIDTAGNLVVKTNLYSTGEVTAYKSGTGVSGLTLQGDMNANGKNITGSSTVQAGNAIIGNDPVGAFDNMSPGLYNTDNDGAIAAYYITEGLYIYGNGLMSIDNTGLTTVPKMSATEFQFGTWTFKQDTSGRLGIYNGTTEVACFNTDGTYVNLPA